MEPEPKLGTGTVPSYSLVNNFFNFKIISKSHPENQTHHPTKLDSDHPTYHPTQPDPDHPTQPDLDHPTHGINSTNETATEYTI